MATAAPSRELAAAEAHKALLNGTAPQVVQFIFIHALMARAREMISKSQSSEAEGGISLELSIAIPL
jgi:hypothetical protein